jgi:hypothetical protein
VNAARRVSSIVFSTVGGAGGFGSLHDFADNKKKMKPTSKKQMTMIVFTNELECFISFWFFLIH